jgi:DNA-binding HxlR family transcriptional regulator
MAKSYGQHCPIAMTLDIIGDRWTILIIRDLYFGRSRFKDLLEASPGMSTKILSERLKLLEQHGLIQRHVYSEHPLRAEYTLTERGLTLEPVLNAIGLWGGQHLIDPKDAPALLAKIDSMRPKNRKKAAAKAT